MATINPNTFTFTNLLAASSFTSSATPQTSISLDLRNKNGAWLIFYIGKTSTTALTRSAYFAVRRSMNASKRIPYTGYDFYSQLNNNTASSTVSSGGAAAATTVTLASGTNFAAGNTVCLSSGASRVEFVQVCDVTGAVLTIDDQGGFETSHNSGDNVTNGADVGQVWLPGGDQYTITPVNNSGQTVIMMADAEIYASDSAV